MENAIFNELRVRGFNVDVGQVPVRIVDEEGKQVRRTYESESQKLWVSPFSYPFLTLSMRHPNRLRNMPYSYT